MKKGNETRVTMDILNPPPFTEAQIAELAALAAMRDEDIDFNDIPPSTPEDWKDTIRGHFYKPIKQQMTVRFDQDEYYNFRIKQDLLHTQLIPLLEAMYPLLYETSLRYDSVLETLRTLPPSEWMTFAEEKEEEAFQFDEYGMDDYLVGERFSHVRVGYDCIALSLEGKIAVESFSKQPIFLKYTMMHAFSQFTLAGALRLYITG